MALSDYSIDTSGTPQEVQRKQKLAQALMTQGGDSTPAAGGANGGWITALNRGFAGALGGYQQGQARQEEQQGRDSVRQQLANGLMGADGKIDVQKQMMFASNPWATSAQIGAINHAQDYQHTLSRDAMTDKNTRFSQGMASRADNRAQSEFDNTPDQYVANPKANEPGQPAYIDQYAAAKGTTTQARPMTVEEKKSYGLAPEAAAMMTPEGPKTLGAASTTFNANIDTKGPDKYDTIMSEGISKPHAALSNGVEAAQTRARDLAAMQGAVDAIQRNGGTTGGMGQAQALEVQKTINAGAIALGLAPPIDEKGISDKEFLTKFNRNIAGAQAKEVGGSRVTNFEMSNYLKANPGLEMSITGNQRLIGIQSQIERRNVSVGNAIRAATAKALSEGKRINPMEIQKIITEYDDENHVRDPITGQDLTQSYTLPEFKNMPGSTNETLAADNKANHKKLGAKTFEKINGQWHQVD